MNDVEQRAAAREFVAKYENEASEKQNDQSFWNDLLGKVLGVSNISDFIVYQKPVKLKNTSWIDGYIKTTKVLIEQKSRGVDLLKPIKQSDGSFLTPFEQAKRYANELSYSERVRWIVTCNFEKFLVYDMDNPQNEPEEILLRNLEKEYYRLNFLVKTNARVQKELEVSIKAGEIIGKIYNAILKQYNNPTSEETLKSLNILCVRLVFCLYAEDAGLFGQRSMFLDYLREFDARKMRGALIDLFKVLDTEKDKRDEYLDDLLAGFPYVNGGLFTDDTIAIPQFTDEIRELLLENASSDFDWSCVSPTIFGALFESTLNPETRRSGGMHYTSVENIHKVIDPLFLDDLAKELDKVKSIKVKKDRKLALLKYQDKLASLKFLDPACGSGNFLTETYLCLRRFENEVLREIYQGEIVLGDLVDDIIKVNINQFYGIEINDFAVTVARTAMWIAESQMMKETEDVIHKNLDFLPLKSYVSIVEDNALRIDWNGIVPKTELNYIMGNPPFVGASLMSKEQKAEAVAVFGRIKLSNSIDYVGAWYHKAASYMQGTNIKTAFVSTNSITQGEQVAALWDKLLNVYKTQIIFGYRTFKWNSEALDSAVVHCTIIGFCCCGFYSKKYIFDYEGIPIEAQNINPYLVDAPDILIMSRSKPVSDIPKMIYGNKPSDGGNLILTTEEAEKLIADDKEITCCIRRYVGARDFINNNEERYCLWLKDVSPNIFRNNKEVMRRIDAVRKMREESTAVPTREKASVPHLFFFIAHPEDTYLLVPLHSSENRKYIPIGFMEPEIIASNACSIVPNATLYHFGVMTSNVHMAWTKTVCGRIKSDYRYSGGVVYNNFPWCKPTEAQRVKIEKTAQGILDARAKYPNTNLSDLYGALYLYPELMNAHRANDRAVMEAYGFWGKLNSESECVAELMKMYQKLVEEKQ